MKDPDWELYMHPSQIMQRCNKCAQQIFGTNEKAAQDWAEMALQKYLSGGSSPETLRDARYPAKKYLRPFRNPNLRYH